MRKFIITITSLILIFILVSCGEEKDKNIDDNISISLDKNTKNIEEDIKEKKKIIVKKIDNRIELLKKEYYTKDDIP